MTIIPTFNDVDAYNLDEITFIGGSYKDFEYYIFNNGNLQGLNHIKALWQLSDYNLSGHIVLSKASFLRLALPIPIELLSTDTENLSGRYVQTLTINIGGNYNIVLARGIINILPAIKE